MRVLVLLGAAATAVLVMAVAFFAFLRVTVNTDDTDCSTVHLPTAAAWAALGDFEQRDLAGDLELCRRYDGLTQTQLTAAFGTPARQGQDGNGDDTWVYDAGHNDEPDELYLTFDGTGRVADTNITRPDVGG